MKTIFSRIVSTWKTLASNKLRTVLTLLGIVIGISSVIVLMSLGNSVNSSITSEVTSFGANNISITPGGDFSSGTGSTLKQKDVDTIKTVADKAGAQITWQTNSNGVASYRSNSAMTSAIGVSSSFWAVNELTVTSGRITNEDDNNTLSRVAVLGSSLSTELFENESPLGKQLTFANITFIVVGVLEPGDSGLNNNDNSIIAPISTVQTYLTGNNSIGQITIKVDDKDQVPMIKNKVEAYLRVSRGIAEGEDSDFRTINFSSILDAVNTILTTLTGFLSAIAAISLVVGGIGIMNIMFVSVSERTKEIGLRKALGANKNDILTQFLVEAIVVTTLGGIIGLIIGIILSIIASSALDLELVISADSILLALGVSITIGIVFGIYPARKAADLTPIDALRFE